MIKRTIFTVLFFTYLILISVRDTHAAENQLECTSTETAFSLVQPCTSGMSAQIKEDIQRKEDPRIKQLTSYLESMHSPLVPHAETLIKASDQYDLPWQLIPAISGVESTFCQHIPSQSYNCWGWNNGTTSFDDYETAIFTVAKTLRTRYFDRGYTTPATISPIYAPPSKTWGRNVQFFMDKINTWEIPDKVTLQMTW